MPVTATRWPAQGAARTARTATCCRPHEGVSPIDARGLDPQRAHALGRLQAAINDHADARETVPCHGDSSGLWISEDVDDLHAAATKCHDCPAITACAAYVQAFPEPSGTWAGLTPRERSRKRNRND